MLQASFSGGDKVRFRRKEAAEGLKQTSRRSNLETDVFDGILYMAFRISDDRHLHEENSSYFNPPCVRQLNVLITRSELKQCKRAAHSLVGRTPATNVFSVLRSSWKRTNIIQSLDIKDLQQLILLL